MFLCTSVLPKKTDYHKIPLACEFLHSYSPEEHYVFAFIANR